jgi:hypothetical protein
MNIVKDELEELYKKQIRGLKKFYSLNQKLKKEKNRESRKKLIEERERLKIELLDLIELIHKTGKAGVARLLLK